MNNSINLQKSLSVLNGTISCESASYALRQNGYTVSSVRYGDNITELQVECSPLLISEKVELLKEVFGYKFNIVGRKCNDGWNHFISLTLKK